MRLERELGHGKDGTVYSTSAGTAVKVFVQPQPFRQELVCYERLTERQVFEVMGHSVPMFIRSDSALLIIEMSVVDRPFLLDFASAFLDFPPDFPNEVLEHWEAEKHELFGDDWSKVLALMEVLKDKYDIYLFDVHPGNITFADDAARGGGTSPSQ